MKKRAMKTPASSLGRKKKGSTLGCPRTAAQARAVSLTLAHHFTNLPLRMDRLDEELAK
jgi:hypothetical protein